MKPQRVSPFPVVSKKSHAPLDAGLLTVEHGTPIPTRRYVNGKYDETFDALKHGSCLVCEPKEREAVRNALVKWLARKGRAHLFSVTSVGKCDDKRARVWLIKKDAK